MRVCALKSVEPPFDPRLFQRELIALVDAGHQVTQIGPYDKREDLVSGVRLLGFPRRTHLLLRPLNWLRLWFLMRRAPADVYQFNDPELLPFALYLAWVEGRTVIFDSFEHYSKAIMSDHRIPVWARPLSAKAYGLMERKIAEQLAAVIVPAIDESGEKRFQHVRRLTLVRNLPPRRVFESAPNPARRRQLVYLGDISEDRRGISTLIEMLSLLRNKDVSLLLLGSMDKPQTRDLLTALISVKQLESRVRFVAEVPYEQVKDYLLESAVGLIPLKTIPRWESDIPQKMFEYGACWLPFVAANLPPPRKYVAETGAGVCVAPGDAQAFATAVDYLFEHPEEARRMGENGRRAFLDEYNWERESRALLALYADLAPRP
jgi:glycosyltransferase involved in cell wall biosynthesis